LQEKEQDGGMKANSGNAKSECGTAGARLRIVKIPVLASHFRVPTSIRSQATMDRVRRRRAGQMPKQSDQRAEEKRHHDREQVRSRIPVASRDRATARTSRAMPITRGQAEDQGFDEN